MLEHKYARITKRHLLYVADKAEPVTCTRAKATATATTVTETQVRLVKVIFA